MNLVDGGSLHVGIAHGLATNDWMAAREAAIACFEEDRKSVVALPEESYVFDEHRELVVTMLDCYKNAFQEQDIRVIQPECEFDFALPNTEHNCIFLHHLNDGLECWSYPDPLAIAAGRIERIHETPDPTCKCWTPHRLVGKTDALVLWKENFWLLEHKTTSITGTPFWNQWLLDIQPTVYLLGIWRSLGYQPSGFVINAICKPSEAQVASYNSRRKYGSPRTAKEYVRYEREAFLRTREDLLRAERQAIRTANQWEASILEGLEGFEMRNSSGACTSYNRLCDFHSVCLNHGALGELESLQHRDKDYVMEKQQICSDQ